jgi:hypothetical protein
MRIFDFEGEIEAHSDAELEVILERRFGDGVNGFWLAHEQEYPVISLLVNGSLATLVYFPEEFHPGFRSVGCLQELTPGEMTTFYLDNPRQEQPMLNESVIHFSDALRAAKEFLHSESLPQSIKWSEL